MDGSLASLLIHVRAEIEVTGNPSQTVTLELRELKELATNKIIIQVSFIQSVINYI